MALTIQRRDHESLWIGSNIFVTVFRKKGRIHVSIRAPQEYRITRDEHMNHAGSGKDTAHATDGSPLETGS